jgi:ligand-binding sensor domain-containing protein/signal transduction histidine kinase
MRRLGFMIAALAVCVRLAHAQQLPIRNYSAKDGLLRNAVRCILQDRDGRMWFGTADGLDRYDGAAFRHFTTSQGLSDNFINALATDTAGTLWIATNFGGITRYHDNTFTQHLVVPEYPASLANHVNCILFDSHRRCWIGTDGGLFRFEANRFLTVNSTITVTALAEDSSGKVWIGTTNGLLAFDALRKESSLASIFPNLEVTALAVDRTGLLLVGTTNGLKHIPGERPHRWQIERLLNRLRKEWIRCLAIDEDNTVWIGTARIGVVRFTPDGMIGPVSEAQGLAGNVVNHIVRDREGNVWFATNTGLSKLISDQIVNYTRADGLPDYGITAVARDGTGAMWFGSRLGLTRMLDGRMTTFTAAHGLPDSYVLTLYADDEGTIWCGTEQGPARIVTSGASSPRFRAYGPSRGWHRIEGMLNRVRAIYRDDDGNLWFGNDEGVSFFHNGRFTTHRIEGPSDERLVAGLVRDASGDVWAGLHTGGIVQFAVAFGRDGTPLLTERRRLRVNDGLTDDHIRCATRTRDGALWFGTRFGGAIRIEPARGTFTSLTTDDGLAANWVNGIIEDRYGTLWLATARGVNRVSFTSPTRTTPDVETLTMFDGLAGDGVNSVYEDVNGTLWLATYNGVARYEPSNDRSPRVPPRVLITGISVLGQEDSAALRHRSAEYDYDHHSIAFEYIGISFRDEARVRYQYMLEGFDTAWSALTERRYVQYTHLPAGTYAFHVRARNGAGVWSDDAATFAFMINPPLWSRWWFLTGALTLLLALLWSLHRYRLRQALAVERLRLRIAADLHDDLGSTLSSIAIAGELARKELPLPAQRTLDALERITFSARSMLERLDDIVWSINPANDTVDDILLRIRAFASEMLEPNGIAYTVNADENECSIPMDTRRQVYLIFKEALNNIVKHAACTSVAISLETTGKKLALTIYDNGRGFMVGERTCGNGLHSMQRRADAIGGTLTITSQQGAGTTLHLTVPIT